MKDTPKSPNRSNDTPVDESFDDNNIEQFNNSIGLDNIQDLDNYDLSRIKQLTTQDLLILRQEFDIFSSYGIDLVEQLVKDLLIYNPSNIEKIRKRVDVICDDFMQVKSHYNTAITSVDQIKEKLGLIEMDNQVEREEVVSS